MKKRIILNILMLSMLLPACLAAQNLPARLPSGGDLSRYLPPGEDNEPELETVFQSMHKSMVQSITVNPDGSLIASLTDDFLKLWRADGKLIRTVSLYEKRVATGSCVDFSTDGKYLCVTGFNSRAAVIIDLLGNTVSRVYDRSMGLQAVCAFSPDGKYLAVGGDAARIFNIEDIRNPQLVHSFNMDIISGDRYNHDAGDKRSSITTLTYNHDGSLLAIGDKLGQIRVYNTAGGRVTADFQTEATHVAALAFSPDGKKIAGLINKEPHDALVLLWTIEGRQVLSHQVGRSWISSHVHGVAFSKDGTRLVYNDFTLHVLRVSDFSELPMTTNIKGRFKFFPGRDELVVGWGNDVYHKGSIEIIDLQGWPVKPFTGVMTENILDVAFHRDSKAFSVLSKEHILSWNAQGESTFRFHIPLRVDHGNHTTVKKVHQFAVSPDGGSYFLLIDSRIEIFNRAGEKTAEIFSDKKKIYRFRLSSDGQYIISSYGGDSFGMALWTIDGTLIHDYPGNEFSSPYTFADPILSSDNRYVFGLSRPLNNQNHVVMYNFDGNRIREIPLEKRSFSRIALSPDGKSFAVGERLLRLYSIEGDLLWEIEDLRSEDDIEFSPDGTKIAVCGANKAVLVDAGDGRILRTFAEHDAATSSLDFSADGRFLITGGYDGRTQLYDLAIAEKDPLSVVPFSNREWFSLDRNGAFDCSVKGVEQLSFVKGLTIYGADQFWEPYFSPGQIGHYLSGQAVETNSIRDTAADIPAVFISAVPRPDTHEQMLEVTVSTPLQNIPPDLFFLFHNGRRINGDSRGLQVTPSGSSRTFIIPLTDGNNSVQGGLYNLQRTVYGRSRVLNEIYEPLTILSPAFHILSVGVGRYQDVGLSLHSPATDAIKISSLFTDISESVFSGIKSMVLTDADAGKSAILGAMQKITTTVDPNDVVVLFFAGHGVVENGIYYYLPYDTDITEIEQTGISVDTLSDFIRGIPANKIVLLFDTCHSGTAVRSLGTVAMSRSVEYRRQIANLAKAQGIAVLSASAADQKAYEVRDLDHGIFTYSFIEAILEKQSSITRDGNISLASLLSTVNNLTRNNAYRYLELEQNPSLYIFGDDFIIGKVPE